MCYPIALQAEMEVRLIAAKASLEAKERAQAMIAHSHERAVHELRLAETDVELAEIRCDAARRAVDLE
jgi:hypothetical protein